MIWQRKILILSIVQGKKVKVPWDVVRLTERLCTVQSLKSKLFSCIKVWTPRSEHYLMHLVVHGAEELGQPEPQELTSYYREDNIKSSSNISDHFTINFYSLFFISSTYSQLTTVHRYHLRTNIPHISHLWDFLASTKCGLQLFPFPSLLLVISTTYLYPISIWYHRLLKNTPPQ